jgi:hypothetical protein
MKMIKECRACAIILVRRDEGDQAQTWLPVLETDANGKLAIDPANLSPCETYFRVIRHYLNCEKNENAARHYVREGWVDGFSTGFDCGQSEARRLLIASMNGESRM